MIVLVFLTTTAIAYALIFLIKSIQRPANYPPGPPFDPWSGNAIQLRREAAKVGGPHQVFDKWSQEFNSDILGLKLGKELVVVVLSYPLIRDVHLKEVFEGRPDNFFWRLRTMGTRMGITSTDGQLWYEHRNFTMKQMRHVGYGRTAMEKHIERESNILIKYIEDTKEMPVWPGSFLAPSVINVLWFLAAGKGIDRDDPQLKKLLGLFARRSKVFDISGGVLTQFPWLRHIAPNRTGYNLIQELNKELHSFFVEIITDHKERICEENEESDLIFAYIKEMRTRGEKNSTFNETQLTMTILDFFIAGSQTTSTTMDLGLMMLALRTDIQEKVYTEIKTNYSEIPEEYPHLGTRHAYPYTEAFIMEVQRLLHILPITGPRRALWDTKLGDYDIPKDTTILIGLRFALMDKEHWGDPEVFRPDRFIDVEGKIIKDEQFIPFGQGRRRCPADTLARACLFSFLVKIVRDYRIEYVGTQPESLQLQAGIMLHPKPYEVKFIKRGAVQFNF